MAAKKQHSLPPRGPESITVHPEIVEEEVLLMEDKNLVEDVLLPDSAIAANDICGLLEQFLQYEEVDKTGLIEKDSHNLPTPAVSPSEPVGLSNGLSPVPLPVKQSIEGLEPTPPITPTSSQDSNEERRNFVDSADEYLSNRVTSEIENGCNVESGIVTNNKKSTSEHLSAKRGDNKSNNKLDNYGSHKKERSTLYTPLLDLFASKTRLIESAKKVNPIKNDEKINLTSDDSYKERKAGKIEKNTNLNVQSKNKHTPCSERNLPTKTEASGKIKTEESLSSNTASKRRGRSRSRPKANKASVSHSKSTQNKVVNIDAVDSRKQQGKSKSSGLGSITRTKSRSPSRSQSPARGRSKRKSRSRSRHSSTSLSSSRSRSRSYSRSRSRSRYSARSTSRYRSHSRSRYRSHSRSTSRSTCESRSISRSRSRSNSGSRSHSGPRSRHNAGRRMSASSLDSCSSCSSCSGCFEQNRQKSIVSCVQKTTEKTRRQTSSRKRTYSSLSDDDKMYWAHKKSRIMEQTRVTRSNRSSPTYSGNYKNRHRKDNYRNLNTLKCSISRNFSEDIDKKMAELAAPVPYDIEKERKLKFLLGGEREQANFQRRNVYAGGIVDGASRRDVERRFHKFGPIDKITLHFRKRGDNYAFVVFHYPEDAARAIKEGNDDPYDRRLDLCFGGRRKFVGGSYVDFDGNASYLDEMNPQKTMKSRSPSPELDFDSLLKMARKNVGK